MHIELLPKELKDLTRWGDILISNRFLFRKIAIMHEENEFARMKGTILNILI